MTRRHQSTLGLIALILTIGLFLPVARLEAAGPPLPPPGFFQAPPTPTPVPLPTFTPTPASATLIPVKNEPAALAATVVVPAATAVPAAATTAVTATMVPVAAPAAALPQRLYFPRLAHSVGAHDVGMKAAPSHGDSDDPLANGFVYVVKAGDTLDGLALEFGRDAKTMLCVRRPDGSAISTLAPGDSILIPALTDLCHQVKEGETLAAIATWYGVSGESLMAPNQLNGAALVAGQTLLIPNALTRYRNPAEINAPRQPSNNWRYGDGHFIWPIARDKVWVSQGFRNGKHMAVDLATTAGTLVRAADTGVVVKAGWTDNGYGYRIILDHGIDYITLYAHLSEYYVKEGDVVKKGDVIGMVGTTGNSTGPHLHFELRDFGYLVDPLLVLPK